MLETFNVSDEQQTRCDLRGEDNVLRIAIS